MPTITPAQREEAIHRNFGNQAATQVQRDCDHAQPWERWHVDNGSARNSKPGEIIRCRQCGHTENWSY